jgi:transposase
MPLQHPRTPPLSETVVLGRVLRILGGGTGYASRMHTRHDLTDEQWSKLEPLLPDRTPIRGGRWMDHRQVIDGVLFRTRSGCAWRDLPPGYGNWKTVYNRHRRWSGDGTWREVLRGLRVDCDILDGGEWVLGTDGTVIRAHHHSAGARHEPPKDIPADVLAPTVLEESIRPVKSTGGSVE